MQLICTNQRPHQYSIRVGEARLIYQERPKSSEPVINLGTGIVKPEEKGKQKSKMPERVAAFLERIKGSAERTEAAYKVSGKMDKAAKKEGGKTTDAAMAALDRFKSLPDKPKTAAEADYNKKSIALIESAAQAGSVKTEADKARGTADRAKSMANAAERARIKAEQVAEAETDPVEKVNKEDLAREAAFRAINFNAKYAKAEKYAQAAEAAYEKAAKAAQAAGVEEAKAEIAVEQEQATAAQKPAESAKTEGGSKKQG